jgi:cell wall-associated NlpC family hydrolase
MRAVAPAVGALLAALVMGCGSSAAPSSTTTQPASTVNAGPRPHPQAVEPVAGAEGSGGGAAAQPAVVSVGPSSGGLAQPVSDATIRRELRASGLAARAGQATLTPSGLAIAPADAPAAVQAIIAAGNQIAHLPYRFGGGHGTFEDTAYDCSGSLSYVLAAAGLLNTTVTSGQLMSWDLPGRGKWVTVFAAPGHTFMYVAGLRFDTVALAQTGSRWSSQPATEGGGFVARHPPGL